MNLYYTCEKPLDLRAHKDKASDKRFIDFFMKRSSQLERSPSFLDIYENKNINLNPKSFAIEKQLLLHANHFKSESTKPELAYNIVSNEIFTQNSFRGDRNSVAHAKFDMQKGSPTTCTTITTVDSNEASSPYYESPNLNARNFQQTECCKVVKIEAIRSPQIALKYRSITDQETPADELAYNVSQQHPFPHNSLVSIKTNCVRALSAAYNHVFLPNSSFDNLLSNFHTSDICFETVGSKGGQLTLECGNLQNLNLGIFNKIYSICRYYSSNSGRCFASKPK